MLVLLSGKTSIDEIARRFGLRAATVEGWRQQALEGIEALLRQGTGPAAREVAFERELASLEKIFTHLAMKHELVNRALKDRRLHGPGGLDDEPHHAPGRCDREASVRGLRGLASGALRDPPGAAGAEAKASEGRRPPDRRGWVVLKRPT